GDAVGIAITHRFDVAAVGADRVVTAVELLVAVREIEERAVMLGRAAEADLEVPRGVGPSLLAPKDRGDVQVELRLIGIARERGLERLDGLVRAPDAAQGDGEVVQELGVGGGVPEALAVRRDRLFFLVLSPQTRAEVSPARDVAIVDRGRA